MPPKKPTTIHSLCTALHVGTALPAVFNTLGLQQVSVELAVREVLQATLPPVFVGAIQRLKLRNEGGRWVLELGFNHPALCSDFQFQQSEVLAVLQGHQACFGVRVEAIRSKLLAPRRDVATLEEPF